MFRSIAITLTLCLAATAAPAGAIYFDATGTGQPIVTSDSPLYIGTTINPQGDGVWGYTLVLWGNPLGSFAPSGLELLHPLTGFVSDSFDVGVRVATAANVTLFIGGLYTSDPSGTLTGHVSTCPVACVTATNDSTFKLAHAGLATTNGSVDVYLRSDVYPVTVPAAVWLLGSALGVMGVTRRKTTNKRDV